MANSLEGTASFVFEGREFTLTLNNRVLIEAEDVLGYSALDAAEEAKAALAVSRNPRLKTVVALFYGAVVQNHRELTESDAIDMFLDPEDRSAQEAFKALLTATDVPDTGTKGAAGNAVAAAATRKPSGGAGTGSIKAGARRGSARKSSS